MVRQLQHLLALCSLAVPLIGAPGVALADDDDDAEIEVPVLITDTSGASAEDDDTLDLDNVVQTAAKGVTTIQEAPAIVTVITDTDIYDRGYSNLQDTMDTVPGWLRADALNSVFPFLAARGTMQSMLFMTNGVSQFDPFANLPQVGHDADIETIKRIEVVTGPGGVLWGANSYLGIMNVITKGPEDVEGVEAEISYGDGDGDSQSWRAYAMFGETDLFGVDDLGLFFHTSYENYVGQIMTMPQSEFSTPLPQSNSQLYYGALTRSQQHRSSALTVDGRLSYGNLNLNWHLPVFYERYTGSSFPGAISVEEYPEDALEGCKDLPSMYDEYGQRLPDLYASSDPCVDRNNHNRSNQFNHADRHVSLDWRTRFADNKAGATVKLSLVQFSRQFNNLLIMAPTGLLEGGLAFRFDATAYRAGASYDGDVELGSQTRLLYGAEWMTEWIPDDTQDSRQGPGREAHNITPYDLARIALPCPRMPHPDQTNHPGEILYVKDCPLTAIFAMHRSVLGTYVNPQWRPTKNFTLDGGVRVQISPEALSTIGYDPEVILGATAVYGFSQNYHAKVNYAQGFRPPVINNLRGNGRGIQIPGYPNLKVERSDSVQGEINGRIFKGKRQLREISFRADYSYTKIQNLIQIQGGRYSNTADRDMHSTEFLGKVYLKGGHRFEVGYTWLKINMADKGMFRSMPEHWFNVGGVFNLVDNKFAATTTVRVMGAMEDPNRLVEYRPLEPGSTTTDGDNEMLVAGSQIAVQPHELTLDRLPPSAELQVGVVCEDCLEPLGVPNVRLRASVYNAFNTRHYNSDGFHDYEPRLEYLPNSYPEFRFLLSAAYAPTGE